MPLRPLLLLLLACAGALAWPRDAAAEVRRCVTPGGQTIFTDRKCSEVQAVERLPRDEGQPGARLQRGATCARSLQDLVFEITSAIDARDANRLAGVYHWPGTSADAGFRIWTQLDAIANRPLVDIVPVMPSVEPDMPAAQGTTGDAEADDVAATDGNLYPQATIRRNPVALRIEQTTGGGVTPARTVFALTRYFGCWWVRF